VGLYGDPNATWGICLEAGLSEPLDAAAARRRLSALVDAHPALGVVPACEVVADDWEAARSRVASAPYGPSEPLLRVLIDADGSRVFVGAHHGAVDGLGLVAVAGAAAGLSVRARARGIGDRGARHGFLGSSLRRLGEALVSPPPRFPAGEPPVAEMVEDLRQRALPRARGGTAHLAHAVVAAFAARGGGRGRGEALLLLGASRRTEDALTPDRRTAYLRLRAARSASVADLRARIAAAEPEPDFPETSARGVGPRVTHLLRGRLGATALLSNLGVLESAGLQSVAMFPATSGPRAVAVGLATAGGTTTLSLRTRRADFSPADSERLLADIVDAYVAAVG
jgi:hypothetical protein